MAVTRHCYTIYAGEGPRTAMMPELEKKLNATLSPHERIVFMAPKEERSDTWYVVTEDLIMGPVP